MEAAAEGRFTIPSIFITKARARHRAAGPNVARQSQILPKVGPTFGPTLLNFTLGAARGQLPLRGGGLAAVRAAAEEPRAGERRPEPGVGLAQRDRSASFGADTGIFWDLLYSILLLDMVLGLNLLGLALSVTSVIG